MNQAPHVGSSIPNACKCKTTAARPALRAALADARLGEGLQRALAAGGREGDLVLRLLATLHLGLADRLAVLVLALRGGGFAVDVHVYEEYS